MLPILLALAFIAIFLLVIIAGQPDVFAVQRSAKIAARPDAVFPHVNELRNWEAWNPWGKIDPNLKLTYAGPPAGVGASYAWSGNKKVGAGQATITESQPGEFVRFKLEFFQPMAGVNDTLFSFRPADDQTEVTWAMTGKNSFGAKIFSTFISMDKMVGCQFEKGLANLKAVIEAGK